MSADASATRTCRYNSINKIAARAGNRRNVGHPGAFTDAPSAARRRGVNPARSSCSRRAEIAFRLPGNALITIRSPGSSSVITLRATWRSRRATRCRCYRRSHRLPHYQPDSRTGLTLLVTPLRVHDPIRVHDDVSFDGPNSVLHRRTEFRRPGHPVPRRQHSRIPAPAQAVSVRRPLRRRFDTTARPARVRIRSRNPCTRARCRLFGWKVRLPLATAVISSCFWHPVHSRSV